MSPDSRISEVDVGSGYNSGVTALTFAEARACVLERVAEMRVAAVTENEPLLEADGRVIAETVAADRDYPPFDRSARDGFAVRSADLPGELRIVGEVRAGEVFHGRVGAGEAVEIMTGAPLAEGADAVVMIEHVTVNGGRVAVSRTLKAGENVSARGCEARSGEKLVEPGRRLGFAEIAMLATVGRSRVSVYAKPRVAIIATGDEIVEVDEQPREYQIRNSNAQSLAVQVARAGGCPHVLPIARDTYEATREIVEQGLRDDLLLLSGGVSAGKYDVVERVLADFGAEFFFDRVLIQPGQPLVFGRAQGKLFFGLPGNPASTMVTFEVFARAAVEALGGRTGSMLPVLFARLATDFRQKAGLTRFLPAMVGENGAEVTPVRWQGSGDVPALARANAFLVTDANREEWKAGDWIQVLMK